mgnify:CR=1 FL=1
MLISFSQMYSYHFPRFFLFSIDHLSFNSSFLRRLLYISTTVRQQPWCVSRAESAIATGTLFFLFRHVHLIHKRAQQQRLLFLSLPQTRGEYHSLIAAFKFGYNHPRHCYRCNLPDSISLVFDAANYNTVPAKYSKQTVKVYGCKSTSSASVEVEFSESDTVTELASPSFSPNAIVQLSPVIINRLKCTERRLTALAVWVNSTELPVAGKKHWWWWCSSAD